VDAFHWGLPGLPAAAVTYTGTWNAFDTTAGGLFYGTDFWLHAASQGSATFTYRPTLPLTGPCVTPLTNSTVADAVKFVVQRALRLR